MANLNKFWEDRSSVIIYIVLAALIATLLYGQRNDQEARADLLCEQIANTNSVILALVNFEGDTGTVTVPVEDPELRAVMEAAEAKDVLFREFAEDRLQVPPACLARLEKLKQ